MAGRRNSADLVYRAIVDLIDRTGSSPTIRELQMATGISSTSVVFHHLRGLERQGLIVRGIQGESRSIRAIGHVASNTATEGAEIVRLLDSESMIVKRDHDSTVIKTEHLGLLREWAERVGA